MSLLRFFTTHSLSRPSLQENRIEEKKKKKAAVGDACDAKRATHRFRRSRERTSGEGILHARPFFLVPIRRVLFFFFSF